MHRKRANKQITDVQKIEYFLTRLTKEYSKEKTIEEYEQFLQGLTHNRELIDRTLKEWEKILVCAE